MFVGEGRPEIPVTPRRVEFCLTTLPKSGSFSSSPFKLLACRKRSR